MASAVTSKGAQRNVESAVLGLAVAAGLPSTVALFYLLATQSFTFEVRWTLVAVGMATWIGSAAAARQAVSRTLLLAASLLGALREGDRKSVV